LEQVKSSEAAKKT